MLHWKVENGVHFVTLSLWANMSPERKEEVSRNYSELVNMLLGDKDPYKHILVTTNCVAIC